MSNFTTPLKVEYLDGRWWGVLEEFDYNLDGDPDSMTNEQLWGSDTIRVPKGFLTDFASIPRILWNLLPPTGQYGKAAVIHDYLYRNGGKGFTRAECDWIFYEAMGVLGVGYWRRKVMYWAVRQFGRSSFKV